jgi:hypothetical protein
MRSSKDASGSRPTVAAAATGTDARTLARTWCSHPWNSLAIDPEGDRLCCDCGKALLEPDLEADFLHSLAAEQRARQRGYRQTPRPAGF